MIIEAAKEEILKFRVNPPLFMPFYNRWGENVYYVTEPFCLNPMTIDAWSTSGSPVILTEDKFFGIIAGEKCTFEFDGTSFLTIHLHKGEVLYVAENSNPYEEWQAYNKLIIKNEYKPEKFWSNLEYCTWVEQSKQAWLSGKTNQDVLDEKFIYNYLEKLDKLAFPKGKFTIDDGWAVNSSWDVGPSIGNWDVDRKKFPNFEKVVKEISNAGYIPGIWLSPFTFTTDCDLAKKYPELIGKPYRAGNKWHYILPDEEKLAEYYQRIFSYYLEIGFRKFKLDLSYGPKNEMIKLTEIIYKTVKNMNKEVEIETHIPDIFATRYADTLRMNDVSIDMKGKWRFVNSGHYTVCKYSSPDRILNLDHVGTNAALVKYKDFKEHFELIMQYARESGGYPTISNLPDLYSEEMCSIMRDELKSLYNVDGSRKDGKYF